METSLKLMAFGTLYSRGTAIEWMSFGIDGFLEEIAYFSKSPDIAYYPYIVKRFDKTLGKFANMREAVDFYLDCVKYI